MNSYKTLNGQIFRLDQLNALDHSIYAEMKSYYDSNIQWTLFTNLWINRIKIAFKDRPPSSVVEEPIYQICQDLDSRLAIRQGCAREPDYRDLLADIIDIHFKSRYKFCKELGIDEGYLSSVLNRKRHFSLKILQEILDRINYRIVFMEKVTEHPSEQKSAIKEAEGSTKPYEPTQHMMNVNEIDDMGKFHKVKPKYFYEMGEYRFLSVDTPQDLEKVLRLRYQVYCVELELKPQNSQGLEQDEYDQYAVHFLAMDRQDKIVATLRIIPRSPTGSQFKSDS